MKHITVLDRKFKPYLSSAEIANIIQRLASEISNDMRNLNPLVCPILSGSFMFAADLLRSLDFDPEISFVKYSSYEGTKSSGVVKEILGFPKGVKGRHLLLVEDIIETGISMKYTIQKLHELQPASVKVCTFVQKPEMLQCDLAIDYVGKAIANDFIVGYGLDYNGFGRTFPDIYILDEDL